MGDVLSARLTAVTSHYDQDFTDTDVDSLLTCCRRALDAGGGDRID